MVANTIEILDAPSAKKDNAVLLQVMTFVRDICDYLMSSGEAHFGNLSDRRIGFLGGSSRYLNANSTTKWTCLQGR